jgi:MoaA/NifB/PqqE/SkfB family radical SAM enzyme
MRDESMQLGDCRTLDEFYQRSLPLGLHESPRFMHLELDLINRCNLRCVMCYHSQEHARHARTTHMTPDSFTAVAARVLPSCYRLSLSLGNEPLMSPHFTDILRIAAPYAVPNVNFFTNAQLLDDQKIEAILDCGVTQVCVSVDGATARTYNGIRRDGDFDRLLTNVSALIAARAARGRTDLRVRFDMVMMQRNVHEMVDLVRLAARLGVDELDFVHLVAFEGLDMERESLRHTRALSNYWLERALSEAASFGIPVAYHPAPFALASDTPGAAGAASPFHADPYCPYPFFHVTMGPGGHVLPCPYSHGEAPFGQVSEVTPVDMIWLGPQFTGLRQRILAHDPPDMCRRCSFLANRHPNLPEFFATRRN